MPGKLGMRFPRLGCHSTGIARYHPHFWEPAQAATGGHGPSPDSAQIARGAQHICRLKWNENSRQRERRNCTIPLPHPVGSHKLLTQAPPALRTTFGSLLAVFARIFPLCPPAWRGFPQEDCVLIFRTAGSLAFVVRLAAVPAAVIWGRGWLIVHGHCGAVTCGSLPPACSRAYSSGSGMRRSRRTSLGGRLFDRRPSLTFESLTLTDVERIPHTQSAFAAFLWCVPSL